jgi:hypothetical protein
MRDNIVGHDYSADNVVDSSMLAALRGLGALPRLTALSVEVPLRASLFRSFPAQSDGGGECGGDEVGGGSDGGSDGPPTGHTGRLFGCLDRLELRIDSPAVPALVASALGASIAELTLTIMSANVRFMFALTPLRCRLRALRIVFVEWYVIDAADLAALRGLTQLTALHVSDYYRLWQQVSAPSLTDGALAALVACLPRLEALELQVVAPLSAAAAPLLRRSCPRLARVQLSFEG